MENKSNAMASGMNANEIINGFLDKEINTKDEVVSDNSFIKVMGGKYGGGFYARYVIDSVRSVSWIQLIVEYPDGDRAEVLINHNICTEATYEGIGIDFADVQYQADKITRTVKRKEVPSIISGYDYGKYETFKKYERPDMPIPMAAIWERIIEYYNELPIKKIRASFSLSEAYSDLIDIGENKDSEYRDAIGYYLDKAEMLQVCNEYNIDLGKLRRELDIKGVLDKDASTKGFQKSKKIKGIKGNYYHIRRREIYEKQRFEIIDKSCDFKANPDKEPKPKVIGGFGYYNL